MAPKIEPFGHVGPPVPLEDETHLLLQLKNEGRLPNLTSLPKGQDPIDCIQQLNESIKHSRSACETLLSDCSSLSHAARATWTCDVNLVFERANNHIAVLATERQKRLRVLRDHVCGDSREFRGCRAYAMLQYLYHDLGDDYLLGNQLQDLARRQFDLDAGRLAVIEQNTAVRKSTYLKRRKISARDLELYRVKEAVAFVSQLDKSPPKYPQHSGRIHTALHPALDANCLKTRYVQSPWQQMVDKAKEMRDPAKNAQSKAASTSNTLSSKTKEPVPVAVGSSYKTQDAEDDNGGWDKVGTLDGIEWDSVSSDVPLDGDEFDLIDDIDLED